MVLKSCYGFMTIQAWVTILGFSYIEISIIILISNLHLSQFTLGLGFLLCFLLVMLIAGAVMITAAYKEDKMMCEVASFFAIIVFFLFIVGSALSFVNRRSTLHYVCVEGRCPETLWLVHLQYRTPEKKRRPATIEDLPIHCGVTKSMTAADDTEIKRVEVTTATVGRRRRMIDSGPTMSVRRRRGPEDQTPEPEPDTEVPKFDTTTIKCPVGGGEKEKVFHDLYEKDEDQIGYVVGAALFIAILLFVVNTIFFLFCCLIINNFHEELMNSHNHQAHNDQRETRGGVPGPSRRGAPEPPNLGESPSRISKMKLRKVGTT